MLTQQANEQYWQSAIIAYCQHYHAQFIIEPNGWYSVQMPYQTGHQKFSAPTCTKLARIIGA